MTTTFGGQYTATEPLAHREWRHRKKWRSASGNRILRDSCAAHLSLNAVDQILTVRGNASRLQEGARYNRRLPVAYVNSRPATVAPRAPFRFL
jgi:ligand-binding SRPBCC domain-containing protein